MKKLIHSVSAVFGVVALAYADAAPASVQQGASKETTVHARALDPDVVEKLRAAKYRAFGDQVRKPGSAKGAVAFLNAQKRVPSAEIARGVALIDEFVHVEIKRKDVEKVDTVNPKAEFANLGCALGVAIADDDKLPSLLIAPEDGWAVVNVARLAEGGVDAEKLAARTRKEIMRAFALIGGCSFMCRGALVMGEVARPVELDDIRYEEYGIDALNRLNNALPSLGVTPWHQTNYRMACREGWAPAPTNAVQQKIWDKVHQLPTNPLPLVKPTK